MHIAEDKEWRRSQVADVSAMRSLRPMTGVPKGVDDDTGNNDKGKEEEVEREEEEEEKV